MSDNTYTIIEQLDRLGLSESEAKVYVELLKSPKTHLELARATGINRTSMYRLVDELCKKSLVTNQTDDNGTVVTAKDPSTLEVMLTDEEAALKAKRDAFTDILPSLNALTNLGDPTELEVLTYDGIEGLKHMLWHELKAEKEILIYGYGTLEDLVGKGQWAEKHRQKTVERGYFIREIVNKEDNKKKKAFTKVTNFDKSYELREISKSDFDINQTQMTIYNNTVAMYLWQGKRKVGVEINNPGYTNMMRQMFELNWKRAKTFC